MKKIKEREAFQNVLKEKSVKMTYVSKRKML